MLDDYGVEEAIVKVEEPAFVVDIIDDKRSVQFSDVAGIDNFEEQAPSEEASTAVRMKPKVDQASIRAVNEILE